MLKVKDQCIEELWRLGLVTYATHASMGRRPWKPYLWLAYLGERLLEPLLAGGARIVINAPPRHGKSELVSHWLPTWFIEHFPYKQIILTSYGGEFAGEWGKKVRDEFAMNKYCAGQLRTDSRAVESWMTVDGGGMKTAGVGGPITGRGADLCFPGDTLISTERGVMPIQQLCTIENPPRVLSYDHKCDTLIFKEIVATRRLIANELVEIRLSSGHRVRSTGEHRFYNPERGYVQACDLRAGDRLCSSYKFQSTQDVRILRQGEDDSRAHASRLLFQSAKNRCRSSLSIVRETFSSTLVRIRKAIEARAQRFLLFDSMLPAASCGQAVPAVSDMCSADSSERPKILFEGLSFAGRSAADSAGQDVSSLQKTFSAQEQSNSVLFDGMQEQSAFGANERERKFPLSIGSQLREMFLRYAQIYFGARREHLRGVRRDCANDFGRETGAANKPDDTSLEFKSSGQSAGKPSEHVHDLSCCSSSLEQVTVLGTTKICCPAEPVYDIQVEGTNNFFAQGILVHNCIIDDPHKNWEEAMSPIARERVIDWFNSTLYTRLEPNASILVIQTRWHEADLSGFLLNSHSDPWQLIRFPALAEDDDDILGRAPGEALCPERFPAERLNTIKEVVGSHIFAGLYQQRPAPLMGGIVKRDWFKYYTEAPAKTDAWTQAWDLTFKATGTSYAVGQTWCRAGADIYLMDRVRSKMDFLEQLRQIVVMSERWPQAQTKLIEDAADAQAVKATLDATISGITLVPARGSKEARLASVAGAIESGHVYLPANAPWLDEFLNEVCTFPGTVNDDQVDAMSLALDRLIQKSYDVSIALPELGTRTNPWEATYV